MDQRHILFFAFVCSWNIFCCGFLFSELMRFKTAENPQHLLSAAVILKLFFGLSYFVIIYHHVIDKSRFYTFSLCGVVAFVLQASLFISSALVRLMKEKTCPPATDLAIGFTLLGIEGICSLGSAFILSRILKSDPIRKSNGEHIIFP